MKRRILSLLVSSAMTILLFAVLGIGAYAMTYKITYDPNGGTPGQKWVDSVNVTLEDGAETAWFTPNYNEEVCAPPEGTVFDGFDVNGQRVWSTTAVQSLLTENTTIKFLWKGELYYMVTYDANGGTKGPDWVDNVKVPLNATGTVDPWFTPNYSADVCAAPEGMVFDGFDVNGQRVWSTTAVQSLLTENTIIKYLWKEDGSKNYIYEGDFGSGTIYKKKAGRGLIFKFRSRIEDEKTYERFTRLLVDGTELKATLYKVRRGSLIVELEPAYLETLAEGQHTVQPVFEDGEGPVVTFQVEKEGGAAPTPSYHQHDFEWQVVREATPATDGEKIYVCRHCGGVSQRIVISGYAAFNRDLADKVKAAAPGAVVKVKTDKWISLYWVSLDELAKRPDVTVVIDFRYKGADYEVTIPAGADIAALKDKNGYAGFLFLGSKFGLQIPAEQ